MNDEEILMTEEGKKELEEKLHYLENVKRAEVSDRIKVARDFGDLSENSEYDDAKEEQGMLEAKIMELNHTLAHAKVVKNPSKRARKIQIGSIVEVQMGPAKKEFKIVGPKESDVFEGKISSDSPIADALMGHKKGEKVKFVGPTGKEISMEILKVRH